MPRGAEAVARRVATVSSGIYKHIFSSSVVECARSEPVSGCVGTSHTIDHRTDGVAGHIQLDATVVGGGM
jgi:hypothetical protein